MLNVSTCCPVKVEPLTGPGPVLQTGRQAGRQRSTVVSGTLITMILQQCKLVFTQVHLCSSFLDIRNAVCFIRCP